MSNWRDDILKKAAKGPKGPKATPWQLRILAFLGIEPDSPEAKDALSGVAKHGRQRRKPKNWWAKKKRRRKIAQASRRINR